MSPISSVFSYQITSFSSWKPIYNFSPGLNNRGNLNKTTTNTNFVDNKDILFYSKKTSFKKVRIVTAGDLGVFVNDTEADSEDTDQGSRSLFFFPPCTLKVKTDLSTLKITLESSPVETRSTLKVKLTIKEMVLHGSRLYATFQNAGNWIRSWRSVGVALCRNADKHVVMLCTCPKYDERET